MNWIKRFWHFILVTVFGLSAVFATNITPAETVRLNKINAIPSTISIDGKDVNVLFTDENIGEDFIIKSDRENYYGMGIIQPIISITNISDEGQNVDIVFSFNGESREVLKTEKPVGEKITPEQYFPEVINKKTGTSTPAYTIPEKVETLWQEIPLTSGDTDKQVERKNILNYINHNKSNYYIGAGKTVFFRLSIRFPWKQMPADEWFIEIFGDKGGYGHLDPAYLTDDFDAYSTGQLNGNGGWAGDTYGDVISGASCRSGNCAEWHDGDVLGFEYSPFDDNGSGATGNQIFYMKLVVGDISGAGIGFVLLDGTTWGTNNICRVWFNKGTLDIELWGGTIEDLDTSFDLGTWYKIEVEWDAEKGTNGQCRAKLDDGSWSSWVEGAHDFDTASHFGMRYVGTSGNQQQIVFDDIQPAEAPPAAGYTAPQEVIGSQFQ